MARPLPSEWKRFLSVYFNDQELGEVRYLVDGRVRATLPWVINRFQPGTAVVMGNVIVFPTMPDVNNEDDRHWIAHEVQHTIQYAELGFEGFALKYARSYASIEAEADDVGDTVLESLAEEEGERIVAPAPRAQPDVRQSAPVLVLAAAKRMATINDDELTLDGEEDAPIVHYTPVREQKLEEFVMDE
jgi:hypothetical protein